MLDDNLPTFIVSPPVDAAKPDSTIFYTQFGNERAPAYTLRKPDPSLPGSKNRYAIALADSFNPEVLFAEVLLIPEWTQPSLSAEQHRQNGGVPPAPEPILPHEFVIQLYNPDQQVVVRQKKPGAFSSTPTWYFEMTQQTFRQPSNSVLDRTQSDPAAADGTPKIEFKWKKDSKFSKDLVCFLSGKTYNPDGTKKRSKEPDITVAIFQHLRELTMYEPNLHRVDLEDWKGFEVILLLGAIAIRDVYFGHIAEAFNISTSAKPTSSARPVPSPNHASSSGRANGTAPQSSSSAQNTRPGRVPPTDPRSQWEIDAETARLKKQTEAEEKERKRREAAEQKEIRRMLEAEEKEKRRKQAEVEKETERLKKLYGKETAQAEASLRPPIPSRNTGPQRYSAPQMPTVPTFHSPPPSGYGQPASHSHSPSPSFAPVPGSYQPYAGGPYLARPGAPASQSGFFGQPSAGPHRLKDKKSFWGFARDRALSGGYDGPSHVGPSGRGLAKKKSAIF